MCEDVGTLQTRLSHLGPCLRAGCVCLWPGGGVRVLLKGIPAASWVGKRQGSGSSELCVEGGEICGVGWPQFGQRSKEAPLVGRSEQTPADSMFHAQAGTHCSLLSPAHALCSCPHTAVREHGHLHSCAALHPRGELAIPTVTLDMIVSRLWQRPPGDVCSGLTGPYGCVSKTGQEGWTHSQARGMCPVHVPVSCSGKCRPHPAFAQRPRTG